MTGSGAAEFGVVVDVEAGARIVRVHGELDLATTPELEAAVGGPAADLLVVDLHECTFLDSSAIRALLSAARGQREAGGRAAIVAAQPATLRVLELAGVGQALPVFATLAEAL